jgi:carboxypeptidase family protein
MRIRFGWARSRPRHQVRAFLAAFGLLVAFSPWVLAQQDAGVIGVVTDESGAVLPGVTVTVTGPALQVPSMSDVTDSKGEFRITPLPIGTYTVEYALSGFSSVKREGIRLTVGFTAKIDAQLKVGALEETITVSGQSPVVDTQSTAATTQFTRETIELIPTSRNGIVSLLAQAPGVRTLRDVGGSSLNQVPTYRVFGQAGEAYSTLEGVQTSSLQASSGQANYWDYTALEEASVRTLGNSAEVPSRGVNLVAIVKSGGNDFHGSTSINKTPKKTQANNIDANLAAQGVGTGNEIANRYSGSSDLGGRIIKDKLWFYTAWRRQIDDQSPLATLMPDGKTPAIAHELSWFSTNKLSYQMSQSNRFVGFWAHNHKYDTSNLSQFIDWNSRGGLMTPSETRKIEWQKVYGQKLVTSFQYGFWDYSSHYFSFAPRDTPNITEQGGTTLVRGPQTTTGQRPHNPRNHFKGNATSYQPDLFVGSHELKMGFDYVDNWFGRQYPDLPADTQEPDGAYSSNGFNYRLLVTRTRTSPDPALASQITPDQFVASQIEVWNNPAYAKVVTHYGDIYFTDTWTMNKRLTLNLGLRYAHDNGFVPGGCRDAATAPGNLAFPAGCWDKRQFKIWNSVAPRTHVAWDITGDGKTVLKGGWGRFDHERQQVPELDAADTQVRTQVVYRWHDLNGDLRYQPGEVDLDPNHSDFVSQSGGSNSFPSTAEVQPKSDELSITLERELMANFSARISGVYSRYHNTYRILNELRPYDSYNIPVTNLDPGPDGTRGTADDPGTSVTYWEYSTALQPRAFDHFVRVNDPKADQTYKSLDIAFFKRLSNNWQLLASYSGTQRHVPIAPNTTTAGAEFNGNVESGALNPNAEIFAVDEGWESSGKLSGVYRFPFDVLTSVNFERRSGYYWARTVRFTGGKTIPNITIPVEKIGSRQLPPSNQFDVRFEKSFKLNKGQRVAVRANAFNIINANTVLDVTRLSSVNFGKPTVIMDPRIWEFSATYSF